MNRFVYTIINPEEKLCYFTTDPEEAEHAKKLGGIVYSRGEKWLDPAV